MKGEFMFKKRRSIMHEVPEREESEVSKEVFIRSLDDGTYSISSGPLTFSAKDLDELVEKLTKWADERKKSKD